MNKYAFLALITIVCNGYSKLEEHTVEKKIDYDIENLYGKHGLNITQDKVMFIKKLFFSLYQMPSTELQSIAQEMITEIEQQIDQIEEKIKSFNATNEQASEILFFRLFILKVYHTHFIKYVHYINLEASFFQNIMNNVFQWYRSIIKTLSPLFKKKKVVLRQESRAILEYIEIEQQEILFNYKKLLLFLELKKKSFIPPVINIWDNPQTIEKIKKRSERISSIEVQAFEFIISLGLQALVMAGGSIAMQWEDDANRIAYEQANKVQNDITSSWQVFQNELNNEQQAIINTIEAAFTSSQKILDKYYETTNTTLQQEIIYLNRSINLSLPIKRALIAPIIYDQYFANSIMNTPEKHKWYNIYQVTESNWGFDPLDNAFWQYGLSKFPRLLLWDKTNDPTASLFTDDPAANSIFTEYAFGDSAYAIEIECTVVNVDYPFFLGIMVNRGHWISGDPERIWQYRLLGLYGTELKKENANYQAIDLCFAQQQIIEDQSTTNAAEKVISPLEQIVKNKETHLYTVDQKDIVELKTNPITYILKLVSSPTSVSCSLSKKNKAEESTPLFTKTIDNLSAYIFMSGGIGFIASGCQARFYIKQPSQLVYTQEQLKLFKNQNAADS